MKVLFIVSRFWPFVGGLEKHVLECAKGLVKAGHKVTVLTTDSLTPNVPKQEIYEGIEIIRKHSLFNIPGTRLPIAPGLYFQLFAGYDVIETFGCIPLISDVMFWIAKMKGYNAVYSHLFDPIGPELLFKTKVYKLYKHLLFNRCIKKDDAITTLTQDYAENSMFIGGYKDVTILPSGVDPMFKVKPWKFQGSKTQKIILFVGRLDKYKGVTYLIDLMKYIKTPDIQLYICGKGDESKSLKEQAKENDNIKFFEGIGDEELVNMYNLADVFVLPSCSPQEAFGKVTCEAEACGCPVITTDLIGVREVAQDCGFVVPQRDPKALAEAIDEMFHPNNRYMVGDFALNGLRKVEGLYNWDEITKKRIALYERLKN